MELNASTTGKEFQMNGNIYEGQTIKYQIKLTNNTGRDLSNFILTGTQTDEQGNSNVTFFNMKKTKVPDAYTGELVEITNYVEDKDIKSKEFQKDIFKNGESINYEYEFTVNEKSQENFMFEFSLTSKVLLIL